MEMINFNLKKFLKKHYWITILTFSGAMTGNIINCFENRYSPIEAFVFGYVACLIFNFIADALTTPYDEYEKEGR